MSHPKLYFLLSSANYLQLLGSTIGVIPGTLMVKDRIWNVINVFLLLKASYEAEHVVIQSISHVRLFATYEPGQTSLSFTISWSLLKFISIESVMPSNHLILCCPLLLPSIFPSIRVFSSEPILCIRWPKYWSFSFSINPSMNIQSWFHLVLTWFDLLAA